MNILKPKFSHAFYYRAHGFDLCDIEIAIISTNKKNNQTILCTFIHNYKILLRYFKSHTLLPSCGMSMPTFDAAFHKSILNLEYCIDSVGMHFNRKVNVASKLLSASYILTDNRLAALCINRQIEPTINHSFASTA